VRDHARGCAEATYSSINALRGESVRTPGDQVADNRFASENRFIFQNTLQSVAGEALEVGLRKLKKYSFGVRRATLF
jgi:hypothetical protein